MVCDINTRVQAEVSIILGVEMLKKIISILGSKKVLAVLIVIAIVVFFLTRNNPNGNGSKTQKIQRGEVISELILSGTIEARKRAVLNFPASSTMSEILVDEGDRVEKGQRLGKIDTTSLNASVMQAQWALREEQATVDRVYDQLKGKATTETYTEKETRTTAEVARDNAYESLVKAQKALRDAIFYAPIDGIVTQVGVETIGASTTLGSVAFEIVDPTTLYFSVTADQTEIGQLAVGQKVQITLDPFEDQPIDAIVSSVGFAPKTGEAETIYEVKVDFGNLDNWQDSVRVGMTGDAKFSLKRVDNVLYVSPRFIKSDVDGKYIVTSDGKKVPVTVGIEGEERVEITGNIKEGDSVLDN